MDNYAWFRVGEFFNSGIPTNKPKAKAALLLTAVVFLLAVPASGQMALRLEVNRKNYLRYEMVFVRLSIRNYGGGTLIFGEKEDARGKLEFEIETPGGRFSRPSGEKIDELLHGLIIPQGATRSITLPLSRYYHINTPGSHRVKAIVGHAALRSDYESNYDSFSVMEGVTFWERTVGVPPDKRADDKTDPQRKYRVVSSYDGKEKFYHLVVEDKNRVYRVARLGIDIGSAIPRCEVDNQSNIHLIIQISPRVFHYFVYDLNGERIDSQFFRKTDVSPILIVDEETGNVVVAGGAPAEEGLDYKIDGGTLF